NGQFGYVFGKAKNKTAAHELGHGVFKLEHPWEAYGTTQGATPLLMDYSQGEILSHLDWKQINDPKFKIYAFQGQSSGELNKYAHLALTSTGKIFDTFYQNNIQVAVTILIAKNYTIDSIKYNDVNYTWNGSAFVANGQPNITVKKIDKTINDKVNLFRSRGDGCTYDYVLIPWNSEDEKTTDVQAKIADKIKEFKDSDWTLSPLDIRDASCSNNFVQALLAQDRVDCVKSELDAGIKNLKEAIKLTDAEKVVSTVNNTCMSAIRNLTYTEIESLINTIAGQTTLKEQSELAVLRLMTAIKTTNYSDFYTYLEKDDNKILKKLVVEIDDASIFFWTDKKNYTNFIGALVTMFNQAPASLQNRWPEKIDDFATRVVNLNSIDYSSDTSSTFSPKYTSKVNKGVYDDATGNITLNDVYTTYIYNFFDTHSSGVTTTDHTEKITEVSPLTPLIIVPNTDKLPLIATALGENSVGNNNYIVPAILLKYQADKIRNDYIEKGIVTTLDLATIYFSGGTALATKVTWVRRAWALAELAGAVGNIAVNTADVSPEMKQVVDTYNLAMGMIGLKNIGQGSYKFIKNLPVHTKELLQRNGSLRKVFREYHLNFKSKFSRAKASGEYDNLDNITKEHLNKQEQVLDDLAETTNVTKSTFTQEQINNYVLKSTKNTTKNKVLLGKFEGVENPNSYNNRAKREGYVYFELDDWDEAYKIVQNDDEMWRINKEFILRLKNDGVSFYLSHNPFDAKYVKGFYKREIELLTLPISQGGLGGKIETVIEGKLWQVIF
ncbi:hypothetical protein ACFFUE_10790, partial [Bergeyella porcorum]|uniref:hypothetical protein n=1 Tax=Bergeyella porcorum TaxID=1735111 RepID=UPI0035E88908